MRMITHESPPPYFCVHVFNLDEISNYPRAMFKYNNILCKMIFKQLISWGIFNQILMFTMNFPGGPIIAIKTGC